MSIIRTERAIVLWAPETSYGVFPGSPANRRFGIHDTIVAPDPEFDWRPIWDVGHTSRSRRTALRGRWQLRGSVPDILLQPTVSARELMGMALGRSSTGSVLEGLSSTDQRLPSFYTQVAYRDTDGATQLIRSYMGCKVNRATWQAREGEELRFSVEEFIAQTVFHNQPGQANYNALFGFNIENADPGPSTTGRYMFSGASINLSGGGISLPLAHARRFSLTIDNQLDPKYYLNRADNGNFTQILTQLIEGKRTYTCDLEVDLQDPSTDLQLWDFLINEGGAAGGIPTGCSITASFETEAAFGAPQQLTIACDAAPTTVNVGSVLKSAMHGIPAPPAGLVPVTLSFDVGTVGILSPV